MKYKNEVPKSRQIRLDRFCVLPGDTMWVTYKRKRFEGEVVEVGAANPEYVLGGPKAKGAGVMIWKKEGRNECEGFLCGSGHAPVLIRLKRSMWVRVEFRVGKKVVRKKLYTYNHDLLVQRLINDLRQFIEKREK